MTIQANASEDTRHPRLSRATYTILDIASEQVLEHGIGLNQAQTRKCSGSRTRPWTRPCSSPTRSG